MAMDEERGLAVREAGSDLVAKTERQEPLLYYGGSGSNGDKTAIEYISDMHLLHHVRYYGGDIRKTVDEAARNIRASHADPFYTNWKTGWIAPKSIFLGDVASDRDVTVEFYRRYWLKVAYRQYKEYKARLMESRPSPESARRQANIKRSVKSIDKCISAQKDEFKRLKAKVDKHLSYSRIIAPKGGINGIKAYLASSYYKKRNLPRSARKKILDAAAANEELCRLEGIKANLKDKLALEEPINLRDFRFDLHRYSPSFDYLGIVILGNHEYVGFPDVDAAVAFYKESLEPLGYAVLQNECIEDDRCVIYGGTGFAAHNERYNATNLVCCDAMTVDRGLFAMAAQGLPGAEAELKEAKARARAYEVEQTRLFVEGYEAARERARKAGKCFICASHYPAEDCLGRIDRDAVYFSGHTHQNRYLRSENAVIYADNQVGYHKRGGFDPRWDMRFKRATTGCARNPYADLADGCYPTTADEYLQLLPVHRRVRWHGQDDSPTLREERHARHQVQRLLRVLPRGRERDVHRQRRQDEEGQHAPRHQVGARQLRHRRVQVPRRARAAAREAGAGLWRAEATRFLGEHPRPHRGRELLPSHHGEPCRRLASVLLFA